MKLRVVHRSHKLLVLLHSRLPKRVKLFVKIILRPIRKILQSLLTLISGKNYETQHGLKLFFTEEIQYGRKFLYFIDQIEELDFHFLIKGWIFEETHEIIGLSVLITQGNQELNSELFYGLVRNDVFQHYQIKSAEHCGFSDSVEKTFTGNVHLKLIATFSDGNKFVVNLGEFKFREPFLQSFRSVINANRTTFLATNNLTNLHERTVALYTHSAGNYFFNEIKALLAKGFQSIHYDVLNFDETSGFANDAVLHIVIAPHEFFGIGGSKIQKSSDRLVLFNTEQLSSEWFRIGRPYFAQAIEVWDLNYHSWQMLNQVLDHVHFLPLGYVKDFKLLGEVHQLPENYFTGFLDEKISKQSFLHSDFENRPIDILFVGHSSLRRQQFFAKNASFFAKYNCYFHLVDLSQGPVKIAATSLDTFTMIGLAQRSKIILNIHHGTHPYFEWHRMIMHGVWQKSLVISEMCTEAPPFIPGRDFIQASLEDLPVKIEYYLESDAGRMEAKKIINSAFNELTTSCVLTATLSELMTSLERVQENNVLPPSNPEDVLIKNLKEGRSVTIFEQKSDVQVEISVIITLFNYADLVIETLNSLLEQSYNFFDLVIVEDCSTDQSLLVAEDWLKKHKGFFNAIKLLHNTENRGLGASRNIAFRNTSTSFVFVLDADNIIFPKALEKLLSGLKNTNAAFAYSYLEHFGNRKTLSGLIPWSPEILIKGNFIDAMVLMRKQIWEKVGGYSEEMPFNGWEDYEMWFKIAEEGEWAIRIPEILCRYRIHDNSMLRLETNKNAEELMKYLKKKHAKFWQTPSYELLKST